MRRQRASRRTFLVASGSAATAVLAGCLGASGDDTERETTPAAAEFDAVVDSAWLEDHLDDVALLDVRGEPSFGESHIDGAHRISETIHDHYEDTDDGYEASPEAIATVLGKAGIARNDDVVVYGEATTMWATHGVYTLEAIGHEGRVFLLDGGLSAWEDDGGETVTGTAESESDPDGTASEAKLDLDVLATREHVAERVHEDGADVQLVDNRTPDEYTGVDENDQFERHGHIPGAVNINFPQNFDGERFRSPEELEQLWLADAGLDPDEELLTYCTTGIRGSVGWFVATQLGWDEVRNYDGSWRDWGTLSEDDGYHYASGEGTGTVVDTFAFA